MDRTIETRKAGFDGELFNSSWRVLLRDDKQELPYDQEFIGAIYYPRDGGIVIQLETKKEGDDAEVRKFFLSADELRILVNELRDATKEAQDGSSKS